MTKKAWFDDGDVVDEVQPDHRQDTLDARNRPHHVLDLLDHGLGAVERNAFGETQRGEDGALVLVRQKALRRLAEQPRRGRQHAGHDHDADDRDAHQAAHHRDIAVADMVDRAQHVAHRPAACLSALEQHRAQRGTQGQGVERGDQHRYRDRHRELAEQLAADAGNEGNGDKDRQQNQRDGEDGAGDFRHRLLAGVRHRQLGLLLDDALDVLDHDDGIIDHDADREHERQQGDGIGRVPDEPASRRTCR